MSGEAIGAAIAGVLVAFVVTFAVFLLIGGLFLRWSVRIVQGFSPTYGRSLLTVFVISLVSLVVSVALMFVMSATGMVDTASMDPTNPETMATLMGMQAVLGLGNLVLGVLLTGLFVHLMIRQPDGTAISIGRGMLVGLLYMLMVIVLAVVLSIAAALLLVALGVGAGLGGGY